MDHSRFSVLGTEYRHQHQAEHAFILVDTVVIDRSYPFSPAVVYQLNGDPTISAMPINRDSLVPLGTLSSLARDKHQLQLSDQTIVSYLRLVTVSYPAHDAYRSTHRLEHGAFRTIHHAIRCSDIRNEIPEIAHAGNTRYSAKLPTLPTTLLQGAASLFVEHLSKEMQKAFLNSTPALGLHCGNHWFCQVHT